MAKPTYDIFISYRRSGGAQYARILQLMLQQRGYTVFLDYDELTDGVFRDSIKAAIKAAPVFMLVLSEGSMERCVNEEDWVRQEIMLAITEKKHIVPINPDNTFNGFPEGTSDEPFPKEIREVVGSHQYSDINFGQILGATVDQMIKNRIESVVGKRVHQEHVDEDYNTAKETLRKIETHNRFMKRIGIFGVATIVLIVLATAGVFLHQQKEAREKVRAEKQRKELCEELRGELERKYQKFHLQLDHSLTNSQMYTVDNILSQMRPVNEDSTLWISQFEFTKGQWYGLLGEDYDTTQKNLPMTEVSFGDVYGMILHTLRPYTGIQGFALPDADEWEYAAHGGKHHETTVYAGSDNVDMVAWYQGNSGGQVHRSDGQYPDKTCNWLDLFDMSGNVAEWCNTSQTLDCGVSLRIVCGGHYNSPASEVSISSKAGLDPNAKEKTVGFRLIIRKYER